MSKNQAYKASVRCPACGAETRPEVVEEAKLRGAAAPGCCCASAECGIPVQEADGATTAVTEQVLLDAIRGRAAAGKLEMAPSPLVESLAPYVARVLQGLGHPEAWVTDLSRVSDFACFLGVGDGAPSFESSDDLARRLSLDLGGVPVEGSDLITDVARRLLKLGGGADVLN